MDYTVNEVLQFVEENDVKFIRLAFCDAFGKSKNLAIMASELPRAFEEGISFNTKDIKGLSSPNTPNDYLLYPDSTTLYLHGGQNKAALLDFLQYKGPKQRSCRK